MNITNYHFQHYNISFLCNKQSERLILSLTYQRNTNLFLICLGSITLGVELFFPFQINEFQYIIIMLSLSVFIILTGVINGLLLHTHIKTMLHIITYKYINSDI